MAKPRFVAVPATWGSNYVRAWLKQRPPSRRPGREKFKHQRWAVCLQDESKHLSYPIGWYGNLFLTYQQAIDAITFLETVGGTHKEYMEYRRNR